MFICQAQGYLYANSGIFGYLISRILTTWCMDDITSSKLVSNDFVHACTSNLFPFLLANRICVKPKTFILLLLLATSFYKQSYLLASILYIYPSKIQYRKNTLQENTPTPPPSFINKEQLKFQKSLEWALTLFTGQSSIFIAVVLKYTR